MQTAKHNDTKQNDTKHSIKKMKHQQRTTQQKYKTRHKQQKHNSERRKHTQRRDHKTHPYPPENKKKSSCNANILLYTATYISLFLFANLFFFLEATCLITPRGFILCRKFCGLGFTSILKTKVQCSPLKWIWLQTVFELQAQTTKCSEFFLDRAF